APRARRQPDLRVRARAGGSAADARAGGGAIVLMASQLSFFGGMNTASYAASKGGVAQLAKALSNELAGRGIRVNAVAPGFVETDMTADIQDWKRRAVDGRLPMGRWGLA